VMFVLPWGEFSYVGTTDTDFTGSPAEVRADAEDVKYLLESANGIFPGAKLTESDVVSTWAGVRPLLAPHRGAGNGPSASATSREHEIWRDPVGLLNIGGGKLTTYRVMARQLVDRAVRELKPHGVQTGMSPTAHLPLPGDPREPWAAFRDRLVGEAVAAGLGADTGEHLARAYGEDADAILAAARGDASLAARLMEGHPYIWAEVVHAVRAEMALGVDDVLVRRLHLFYEAMDGGLAVAERVARLMAAQQGIGWSAAQVAAQVDAYGKAVEATRGFGG
ncbi:MAG: FAD-dependent oxidoreductase, partial [Gemmatimonadetes bacterium]|nr:FAD-dependent oxidoreductase [Gemmatimonadota bacterium]